MTLLRTLQFIVALAILASPAISAEDNLTRFEFSKPQMGTLFRIVVYAKDNEQARQATQAAFDRIGQLNQIMSDYVADSELMQLCAKSGGEPVKVSPELFEVLAQAQKLAEQSKGAFDVTIGPQVQLWRKSRKSRQLPTAEELNEAKACSGYQHLKLDPAQRTVHLLKKGMRLDLGGIAKGYAGDEALTVLKKQGITSALIAAGGDIVLGDAPPEKKGWTVAIAQLYDTDQKPLPLMLLANAAVSTSGDAEQFVEIDGRRYSHVLDPQTGLGLPGRSSVTVVAPRGLLSDGLDTMVAVLGPEKGLPLIDAVPGAAALILIATPNKGERHHESAAWDAVPKTEVSR